MRGRAATIDVMEHREESPLPIFAPPPTEIEPVYEPPSPVREDRSMWKRVGGAIVALGVLLAKLGAQLKFLLLLLPKLKLFTTAGSMLVSIGAYSLLWGWQFAVGFVLLLLIHELGHAIQLRREGVKAGVPVFIPFLGAVIGMKELPKDAGAEARVGLAGPVLGSLGCLVPLALYGATGNNLFRALAFIGFFLNLINLLPVLPLDGGRAMAALTPWMWIAGYAALVVLTFAFPNPIMFLVLLLGGMETWRRFQARKSPESQAFHSVRPGTRLGVAAVYIGLAALLAVGLHYTHLPRTIG
jgi:Zn-dependent protease